MYWYSLRVAVPPPPQPPGETEARERLGKPDTNGVPWRHSNLCKIMSIDTKWHVLAKGYRDKQKHWSEFIFHFLGKFAIQRPSSNISFALKI